MTLAERLAQQLHSLRFEDLPQEVVAKVKIALIDYLSCAYESQGLPWPSQALALAKSASGPCTILGDLGRYAATDAIFANAVLGHSLVREDMHTGSVSHLGIVVFPALLAASETQVVSGRDFLTAAVAGYEAGGGIGRALMKPANVHQYRPTGFSGPFAGVAALAAALRFNEEQTTSALCFAANSASGLNQWPYSGGDEMFFQPGYTARNAWTSAALARSGANASHDSLDGEAGLFRALQCEPKVELFKCGFELMQVFHKPAPACNYAQTGSQAAARASKQFSIDPSAIESVTVYSTAAAIAYPGCNYAGPFERTLQAKMSIHFCVAAALAKGEIAEANYRKLDDPEINRIARATTLVQDDALSATYPAKQGSEVAVKMRDGQVHRIRMDDVAAADEELIRSRFRNVCGRAAAIEEFVNALESQKECGALCALLQA